MTALRREVAAAASISLSENGRTSRRWAVMKPSRAPSLRNGTIRIVRLPALIERRLCGVSSAAQGIGDLDITFATQQPLMDAAAAIRLPKLFDPKWGHAVISGHAEIFAVIGSQCAMLDAAKGVRLVRE